MTLLLPNPTIETVQSGANVGNAPNGSQMQGNPQPEPIGGVYPPQPMNTSAQLAHTEIARGEIPLNVQPTNVNAMPGGQSLLALLSTGQLSLNQSNYGQGGYTPALGAGQPGPQSPAVAQPTGQASGITLPATPNYTGN